MSLSRRDLLQTAGAGLVAVPAIRLMGRGSRMLADGTPDFAAVRQDFPRAARKLWLAAAETHPFSVHAVRVMEEYAQQRALSHDASQHAFNAEAVDETKQLFANLINATPNEVAFVQSTTDGENVVIAGMDLAGRGGNVVIDDLHFTASRWIYEALERDAGVELRIVRQKNWTVDPADMAKAIDKDTRIVSVALVNNINGFLHDMRAIADVAHDHGALVYADIIQAAGNTPVDVKAMGIDCAACTAYKWLMGDFGFAFLYVRDDLQGTAVKQTRYGLRQVTQRDGRFEQKPGAAMYEGTSSFSYVGGLVAREGLRYLTNLGVDNIRAHAKRLTDRLQKEMPALGYPAITPMDNPTPIVSFLTPDTDATNAKLQKAFGERIVSARSFRVLNEAGESEAHPGLRIGVSVYNNDDDIDQFLEALG